MSLEGNVNLFSSLFCSDIAIQCDIQIFNVREGNVDCRKPGSDFLEGYGIALQPAAAHVRSWVTRRPAGL